ncbi:MAG: hypothetical protein IH849_11300, partial [Acidobacteria bacterium]|nr:hypothetical protein [Acidobacteriota bacterium]
MHGASVTSTLGLGFLTQNSGLSQTFTTVAVAAGVAIGGSILPAIWLATRRR